MEYTSHHFKTKLKIGTTNRGNIPKVRTWIEKKQALKEIKVGIDSKESFAQMDKNSNAEN